MADLVYVSAETDNTGRQTSVLAANIVEKIGMGNSNLLAIKYAQPLLAKEIGADSCRA